MYDKDMDDNTDMNYDDINEEGIPPYDLPNMDGMPVPEPQKEEIPTDQMPSIESSSELPPEYMADNEHEIQEISLDNMNDENSSNEQPLTEVFGDETDAQYASPSEDISKKLKKHSGAIWLLPVTIIVLGLFLGIFLLIWYSDSLNIPFLSNAMAKIHGGNSTKIIEVDENKIDLSNMPVGETGNEEIDSELRNLLDETSEDTGIELTRNGNPNAENIPNPMNEFPAGAPGMPSGMGNNPQNNGAYPSIPNAYGQQTGFENPNNSNLIQPYSRNIGRLDPFNPSGGTNQMFDIIVPPTNPTPDEKAQQLMALKISGIMYTADSPSAIINIAGSDQLVRKGDKFNGFSVEKITKDKVTVKAGANVYTASVGEILNIEQVGVNSIPNLNKKFGGPYSKGNDRIIEINMLE